MKKILTTLTVLTFALGLTASGYTQTAAPKAEKPSVQTQAPASGAQVTPVKEDKGKEAAKPVTKEGEKEKGQKTGKELTKKETGKKPAEPMTETKKEEKKEATK